MPVLVEYVVERTGLERMTFTSKAEADAYDKLLDTAESISQVLVKSELLDEKQMKELAMYLACHRDDLITSLAQKRKSSSIANTTKAPKSKEKKSLTTRQPLLDIVIETDEEAMSHLMDDAPKKKTVAA